MNFTPYIQTALGLIPKIIDLIAENSYKSFFHKSNAMFLIAAQDGTIIELNDYFAAQLGYKREDLKGTMFMRLVHPADHAKTKDAMEELAIGGVIEWTFQNRYRKRSGDYIVLEWVASKNGKIYATAKVLKT